MKSFYVNVFIVLIVLLIGEVFPQFNLKQNNSYKYFIRHSVTSAKKDTIISNYLLDSIVNKSPEPFNSLKCVYSYDEQGRLSYYDEYSNFTDRISFYYDSLGNITLITGRDSKRTNIYDEYNNNITQLFEVPGISQNWVPWMLDSLFYDTSGCIIKERDFYWVNEWEKTVQKFYYYKNGLLDSVLFGDTDGTRWINSANCKFYYNEFAAPDSVIWKMWRDTNWVDYLHCIYNYDNAGNLISGLVEDKTGMNSDYRFNYSYNKNNCFYYGQNEINLDGSWIPGDEEYFTSRQDIFQPDVFGTVSNSVFTLSFAGSELYVYYKLNPKAVTSVHGNSKNNPGQFNLFQNYPNPFNPSTTIKYSIPTNQYVIIKIYDILGKEIETLVNEEKQMGEYEVNFVGHNLTSGIYIYSISAGPFTQVRKMLLIK
jgi:hypothetical protein